MTASTFVRRVVKDALRIDRAEIEPWYALRCTVGVALPLLIALLAGHPLSGVSAALGAMCVGFASRQGVYRTRAAVTILTSAATALGALVGSLSGDLVGLNIALTAVWGFAFGIIAALGNSANAVGLNSLVALIVFSQFGFSVEQAAEQAGLVFAGGALQTVLLVLVWPLQRFSAERGVLERAYRGLGEAAAHPPPQHKLQPPASQALAAVSETLADPQPFAKRGETAVFEALLAEAERIRGTLAALTTDRYALVAHDEPRASQQLRAIAAAARDVLVEIADALHGARAPAALPTVWTALDRAVDALEAEARALAAAGGDRAGALAQASGDARALAGQLRAAWRAGKAPVEPNPGPPSDAPGRLFRPDAIVEALATLRANCTLDSAYGRHAVRIGVTMGLACIAEHLLPLERAYWIPLTAAIVLRPDFGATLGRGTARVGGTMLGALTASLIALTLHPGPELYLGLALAFAALAYLTVGANYALFSVGITAYVVFLLAFGGLAAHTAVFERLWATLLGGMLALGAYVVWPAWERERISDVLATVLDKQRIHGGLVLDAYADPAGRDDAAILAAQFAARVARSNADVSVDRMLAEPVHARAVTVRAALGFLAATRRCGLAWLTLQARLPRAAPVPAALIAPLRAALDDSLELLAAALRSRTDPAPLPPLRERQVELKDALASVASIDNGMLVSETDLIVDSIKMIADLLHRLHAADREPAAAPPAAPRELIADSRRP